ncbi:hypothetical protein EBME_1600 [bacterium endosymbiont of Mortierella elongata FMR23-6]|nr:hypothetical protein EBME_1600 [bacterium endosymbiont of Mortierella elongata FMR23-6]
MVANFNAPEIFFELLNFLRSALFSSPMQELYSASALLTRL